MPRGHHHYSRMTELEADEAARGSVESSGPLPKPQYIPARPAPVDWLSLPLIQRAEYLQTHGPNAEPLGEPVGEE